MSSDELRGKVVAVTGASSGIGLAVAETLAHHGAAVVGFARRFTRKRIEQSPEAEAILEIHLDVTDEKAVAERLEELGQLDALILSHGGASFQATSLMKSRDLRDLLESHVVGSANCCREALRLMKRTGKGNIVFVSSIATRRTFAEAGAYTAAKMGQLGLARVLTEELRTTGIRVTSLIAGAVNTPLWDDRPGFDRERMLVPSDIAGLVVSVLRRPQMALEEIVVGPPLGAL